MTQSIVVLIQISARKQVTELRPFNQIMLELLEAANMTRDELSEALYGMASCPLDKEKSSAPSVELIAVMSEILKPSLKQEMELFRSVALLIAIDEKQTFCDMFKAYRRGFGLHLENIGKDLSAMLENNDDDLDFGVLATLYEMGAKLPNHQEIQALIKVFGLNDGGEISNFIEKVRAENRSTMQVVGKEFSDDRSLTKEKISAAKELLAKDSTQKTEFIVSEAAKFFMEKKE